MSETMTGAVRAIALVALLLPLALSEDSSFIALWQVPHHKNIYILHTVYKAFRHMSNRHYCSILLVTKVLVTLLL